MPNVYLPAIAGNESDANCRRHIITAIATVAVVKKTGRGANS
jgi:hypothetical protein